MCHLLTEKKYVLLVFHSVESFGEVNVLLDFANSIESEFSSVFLSLDKVNSHGILITQEGHDLLFLYNHDGTVASHCLQYILEYPPEFVIASDYSQFNVWHSILPGNSGGDFLFEQLKHRYDVKIAVSDLAGLSLECTQNLRKIFDYIIIPESNYEKPLSCLKPDDIPVIFVAASVKCSSFLQAKVNNYLAGLKTCFISYPRPNGWHSDAKDDPFSKIWAQAIENAINHAKEKLNIILFDDLASKFQKTDSFTILSFDASVELVNRWLREVDVLITSNWCSSLASRASRYGAVPLITYNDWEIASPRDREYMQPLILSVTSTVGHEQFSNWLPHDFESCWPGVDVSLTNMIKGAKAIPLFSPEKIITAIQKKQGCTDLIGRKINYETPLSVSHMLAKNH